MLVTCSVEDCENVAHARGWCKTHYSRWRLYGDPVAPWRNNTTADRNALGMSGTRTYKSWQAMRERCLDPDFHRYHRYGGRGITICERWLKSFAAFYEDMGERPSGMTLDRIDPDGNYEPGNCRWATNETQQANRSHKAMPIDEKRRRDREYAKRKYWEAKANAGV